MKISPKNDIFHSVLLHAGFVFSLILYTAVKPNNFADLTYVEVSFGLNENLVQTQQLESSKSEGETLALKAKDALPQLTKNSAPKISQPEKKVTAEDSFKIKEPIPQKDQKNEKKIQNTKLENQKNGNLDMKDFLKRKEESLRKTGNITQAGQKKVEQQKKGAKHSIDEIPRSPFDTVKVKNAPTSIAPTGTETGANVKAFDAYKTYLRNQLKLNWNVPDLSNFPAYLTVVVSFTVNEFGYLTGTPKIVESSHNSEFDKLVIEAVNITFPVGNPPPKEIKVPQTFLAKYNSKDVR